jgi:hypothetical protein
VVWAILEEGKQNMRKYSTQNLIIYYIINLLLELQNNSFNLTRNKLRTSVLSISVAQKLQSCNIPVSMGWPTK